MRIIERTEQINRLILYFIMGYVCILFCRLSIKPRFVHNLNFECLQRSIKMPVSNMLSISLNKLTQLERSMNTNVDYIVFHDQFKGNASTNFLRSIHFIWIHLKYSYRFKKISYVANDLFMKMIMRFINTPKKCVFHIQGDVFNSLV